MFIFKDVSAEEVSTKKVNINQYQSKNFDYEYVLKYF